MKKLGGFAMPIAWRVPDAVGALLRSIGTGRYHYKVSAINAAGEGEKSDVVWMPSAEMGIASVFP